MANVTTEFFETLEEAEAFRPICADMDVYGLDKPGTVHAFIHERDWAMALGRVVDNARAVVKMWR